MQPPIVSQAFERTRFEDDSPRLVSLVRRAVICVRWPCYFRVTNLPFCTGYPVLAHRICSVPFHFHCKLSPLRSADVTLTCPADSPCSSVAPPARFLARFATFTSIPCATP